MKRLISLIAALALCVALAAPALAVGESLYATKDRLKVYEEPDKDSDYIQRLDLGEEVVVVEDLGSWMLVDTDEVRGYVQAKYLSDDEPCDHEWTDWEVIKEPTCTRKGEEERECEICGAVEKKELPKLDHEFGRWETVREATCTRTGERERECQICGYVQTEEIPKTPHEFAPWHVTEEATDHSQGVRSHICQICGEEEEVTFDPDGTLRRGSKGEEVRELQELLKEQGYLKSGVDGSYGGGTETAVKNFQRDQGLNPDGVAWPQTQKRLRHDFGPWTTSKALTRTEDGERTRTCKDCGFEEHQTVAAEPAFQKGARGEGVRFVQTMLNDLGYNAGSADGAYGGKLDSAFTAFAAENNLTFAMGDVLPADIDALANRWIESREAEALWMGRAEDSAEYDLTLTVTPTDDSAGDIREYEWTLTNAGSKSCKFNALLLGFGGEHDFKADNFVLAVDNAQLKAHSGNTLSGTCTLSTDWGGLIVESVNFCALVTSEKDGEVWLSNNVVYNIAW